MTEQTSTHFIIIDDDSINNFICRKFIQIMVPDANVEGFTDPQEGIEHIESTYPRPNAEEAILFLDINMPVLSGWDVLDKFINFPEVTKQQFKIFMLSSSVNTEDKQKASNNPMVSGFIEKPLTIDKLQTLFPRLTK
jgi:CheY-like chemotaxis protein